MSQSEKNGLLVAGLVVTLLLLFAFIGNYWMAPLIFEQNRQAGEDIAREEMDRESALKNYREFRDLWYEIKAEREQLETARQQEERFHNQTWPDGEWREHRDTRTEHERLHQRIQGHQNQISSMTAEYNAMSEDATAAVFACGLPYNIDEKLYIADATGVEYTSQEAMDKTPPENPEDCKFSGTPPEGTVAA